MPGAEGEQDRRPFLGCYQRYQHRSASLSLTCPLLRGGTKNVGYSISVAAIKNARQRIMISNTALHSFGGLRGHAHFVYWCALIRIVTPACLRWHRRRSMKLSQVWLCVVNRLEGFWTENTLCLVPQRFSWCMVVSRARLS